MPSWCDSYLDISGDADAVAAIRLQVIGFDDDDNIQDLTFSTLLPDPDLEDDTELMIDRSKRWGTKWQPSDIAVTEMPYGVRYRFRTPYSPPIFWAVALSERHRDVAVRLSSVNEENGSVTVAEIQGGSMSARVLEVGPDDPRWAAEARQLLAESDASGLLDDHV